MDRKELKITLKSDLCVGSGYSYAGIVDSDISYDDCGLPYIPAKRIKGCLREAAELIGFSRQETEKLFGRGGEQAPHGVFLGNAYIENYEKLYLELKNIDPDLRTYATPQSILEQFTSVKAQTKIMSNGVAKDTALRFIRVVKQHSPITDNQELSFYADVEFVNLDEQDRKNFGMIVKALRNMGLNRNRGLGSVRCSLCDVSEKKEDATDKDKENKVGVDLSAVDTEDDVYVLSYCVQNTAPLVLSADNGYTTEKYISGQSVLGFFASSYLKNGNSTDAEFAELFLKNQVIFSGLYPSDEPDENGDVRHVYYPAPSYINCLKKTKKYVNISKDIPGSEDDCKKNNLEEAYARGCGNQPKKLKDKFVCIDEQGILVKEIETDIVYHHTKKSQKQDAQDGELLYSFETVRKQQTYVGTITGKGKYIRILGKLLEQGRLRFGKSRSAQYGICVLKTTAKAAKQEQSVKTYPAGSRILVTLQSDAIFVNSAGYTVRCDEVRQKIKEALGIEEIPEMEEILEVRKMTGSKGSLYSEIEVRELMGYYSKWNLKRQAIPIVRAGSTFEFILFRDLEITEDRLYAGERIGEGYGRLRILENNSDDCRILQAEADGPDVLKADYTKEICKNILLKKMKDTLRNAALESGISIKNPSTLGRIILMLTESIDRYPDDADKAYVDFCGRIDSIKTKDKREEIKSIKNKLICEKDVLDVKKLKYLPHIASLADTYNRLADKPQEDSSENGQNDKSADKWENQQLQEKLKGFWSIYFMDVLVQEKYRQKKRERQKNKEKNNEED